MSSDQTYPELPASRSRRMSSARRCWRSSTVTVASTGRWDGCACVASARAERQLGLVRRGPCAGRLKTADKTRCAAIAGLVEVARQSCACRSPSSRRTALFDSLGCWMSMMLTSVYLSCTRPSAESQAGMLGGARSLARHQVRSPPPSGSPNDFFAGIPEACLEVAVAVLASVFAHRCL